MHTDMAAGLQYHLICRPGLLYRLAHLNGQQVYENTMPTPTQKVISSSLAAPVALSPAIVGTTAATAAKNVTPARPSATFGLTCASTMLLTSQKTKIRE